MLWSPLSRGRVPVPLLVRHDQLKVCQGDRPSMCAPTTSGMVPKLGPACLGACFSSLEWISAPLPVPHLRRETPKPAARRGRSGRREQGPINSSGMGPPHGPFIPRRYWGQCVLFPSVPHRQKDSSEDRSLGGCKWFFHQHLRAARHPSTARRQASFHCGLPHSRSHTTYSR